MKLIYIIINLFYLSSILYFDNSIFLIYTELKILKAGFLIYLYFLELLLD